MTSSPGRSLSGILVTAGLLFGLVTTQRSLADDPGELQTLTGIDVLAADGFAALRGKRVGLITNHTGTDRDGIATVTRLHQSDDVELVALFSPEHGIYGTLDQAKIDDMRDPITGLPVFSLYGDSRRPSKQSLAGIDVLVFDIQDIGTRFYTYISTMGEAMEVAAAEGVAFMVLDRPNPIGGVVVQGPVTDDGLESFVAYHDIPIRHGMTIGELAMLFQAERGWELDLQVIPVRGWSGSDWFDATGLRWINPSPNMRSLTQATLYPGVGILETTNVSVGRGTDTPFEVIGAPWIDELAFAAALNDSGVAGVRFVPIRFTPDASKFAGESCGGVNLIVTDRDALDAVAVGIALATTLRSLYPSDWQTQSLNRLLCDDATRDKIIAGQSWQSIVADYQAEQDAFGRRRQAYLIYPR